MPSRARRAPDLHHDGREPHLLREIVRTHQVMMAGFSRQAGMPSSRFALMRLLANAEGEVGVMALARQLGINAAAVTRQLQEMEAGGLLRRRAHPRDGRRSQVALSAKGLRTFEKIHARTHALEQSLASVIGAQEMAAAAAVLARLRAFLEQLR